MGRRFRRSECSCRSWRGAAGRCTRRSTQCFGTPAPSAWRRRRKRWSGTGWGRPACSASPVSREIRTDQVRGGSDLYLFRLKITKSWTSKLKYFKLVCLHLCSCWNVQKSTMLWNKSSMSTRGSKPDCISHDAPHLMLKETVLQGFVAWVASCTLEQQLVLLHNSCNN